MRVQQLIKEVNCEGINIVAYQENGKEILVGIKSICNGLGIDYNGQYQRIRRDETLSQGMCKVNIPTNSGIQESNMMIISFLPFFLVGIKVSMVKPEIKSKLLDFKLKAKDVLAAAFLPQQTEIKPAPQNHPTPNHNMQTLQQTQQILTDCSLKHSCILLDHETRLIEHEESITTLNQFKEEIKAEVKQIELLTQDAQELKAVNLIPRLSIQDVVGLDYKEFTSKAHSLVVELASKRKEVIGNTYNYLYKLIYSNKENWHDMSDAIGKQMTLSNEKMGMMGFNIQNSKLIYDHLPLRKTYVKTLLAALYS